jgi:uncharacterized membrane protein SirB2
MLFISRGVWIYLLKQQLTARWQKVVPHVNDSVLLITGVTLAIQTQQYPLANNWLTVKLGCLLAYIILGMLAMKWFRATKTGFCCWLGAIAIFIYMVSVALTRHPAGLFL